MQKYGFVYIWRDRKHNRYYIGSHWGNELDSYICSSTWMRNAYNRRTNDFKRRIISRITTNRKDLLEEEQRWLNMIKPNEKKVRYYNINLKVSIVDDKQISNTLKEKKIKLPMSESTKEKIRQAVIAQHKRQKENGFSKLINEKIGKSCKGKVSRKKGKTYEELYGKENAVLLKEKLSISHIGTTPSNSKVYLKGENRTEKQKQGIINRKRIS